MNIFEIYVKREYIENEFSIFLKNKKRIIWSIYGVGGIGKSTLLNRFYDQTKKDDITSCFFDYANHSIEKNTGLEILLYSLIVNDCKTFEKLKKIISKKHRSFSQRLDKFSDTAGAVPLKSINSLITELDKDAEYTKELGIIWNTIIGTIKVGAKLFNRDKKNELITNNPELHLITALLADIEKNKKGVIFIDTFEKLKDITVSTSLHIIGNELTSSNEEYELSFEQYVTLILKYLYKNKEKADIKTIIAGRAIVSKIDNIGLKYIKQSIVNKFEPEQILDYLEQKDFILPEEDIINEIQEIIKGNPLILEYLTEFIQLRYEDEWTWTEWSKLKKIFINSDDENGLIYYLTDRIATHISGWENTLWKLTIPLKLNPEIAEILYPKQEDDDIYGKKYFKLLHDKGILRKGKKLDNNYYLLDELKTSLEAYTKKRFSKNGNNPLDNKDQIELHKKLRDYYDKLVNWQDRPNEYVDNTTEIMTNHKLFFTSYHAFGAKKYFEKDFSYLNKNRFEIWELIIQSRASEYEFIPSLIRDFSKFSNIQINKILSVFVKEKEDLEKIYSKEFSEYVRNLKLKNQLSGDWKQNKEFLISAQEKFPKLEALAADYMILLLDEVPNFNDGIKVLIEHMKKTKEITSKDIEVIIGYAKQTYNNIQNYYLKAIKINPTNTKMIEKYVLFETNIKNYDDLMEEYYLSAIEIDPKYAQPYMNLGFSYLQKGKLNLSEKYLLKSVELGSNDFGNMNLAHVYFAEGNKQQAFETYKKSIESFSDNDRFFEGFDDDFQYLEQYGITKIEYDEMKNRLSC